MNLERVEERCLKYLGQATDPLVPVGKLLEYCMREDPQSGLTGRVLLDFLRNHELVRVVDGPEMPEPDCLATEPRAILAARLPDREELRRMLERQLDLLLGRIKAATDGMGESVNPEKRRALAELGVRAEELAAKIAGLRT